MSHQGPVPIEVLKEKIEAFNGFQRDSRRSKNVNKYLRLALATQGEQRQKHMDRAEELAVRYWPEEYQQKVSLLRNK